MVYNGESMVYLWLIYGLSVVNLSGWWYTYPYEKYEFVNWDHEIPNIWKNQIHVPKHQLV